MASQLRYNVDLPEDIESILQHDFWILENIGPAMLKSLTEPVKFAATTWIVITRGSCKADINLVSHEVSAPAFASVKSSQIMQPTYLSEDFNASIIVMSKRFTDNLFLYLQNSSLSVLAARHPVVKIPEEVFAQYLNFFRHIRDILAEKQNPYGTQALMYELLSFIHRYAWKTYEPYRDELVSRQGRMSGQFLLLVQENFRKERFLEFYADKLEVTPKHLSRTVKKQTGYTAVEWIERYVVLEAKVLLKSSNLNIQQIANELNFPSQSFFGKYFKKLTGLSPKEFRNS